MITQNGKSPSPSFVLPNFPASNFPTFRLFRLSVSNSHQTASADITIVNAAKHLKAAINKQFACIIGADETTGVDVGKIDDVDPTLDSGQ